MRRWIPCLLGATLLLAAPAVAEDWSAWADLETIEVLTESADGGKSETTIWILVLDGAAFIRTSSGSPWGDVVEVSETIGLRAGDEVRTVRPSAITDPADRERVIAGFRAKYGFVDGLLDFVRGEARIWSVTAAP